MHLNEEQQNRLIEFLALQTDRWLALKRQYRSILRGESQASPIAGRPIHAGIWLEKPVEAVCCMVEEVESWNLSDPAKGVLTCRLRDVVQLLSHADMDGAAKTMDGLIDLARGYDLGLSKEQENYLSTWAQHVNLLISD